MHCGKLTTNSAAGRVYRELRRWSQFGSGWVNGWQLSVNARTTAVSTRISEIRHQLPPNERIEKKQDGRGFYYRLVQEVPSDQ